MVECNMLRALSCDLEQQEEAVRKRATEAVEAADAKWQSQIDEVVQQSLNTNLSHVLNAKAAAKKEQSMRETAEGQLAEAELRLRQHKCAEEERRRTQLPYASAALSQAAIERGEDLRSKLKTEEGALKAAKADAATALPNRENTRKLVRHVESVIFGCGRGDLSRTRHVVHALLDRPVMVKRLLTETPREDKRLQVSAAMLKSASCRSPQAHGGAGLRQASAS